MTLDQRIEFLVQSIESHDRQIGELTDAVTKLVAVTNEDATAIRTLARIAEVHEKRISQVEGSRQGRRNGVFTILPTLRGTENNALVYPEEI